MNRFAKQAVGATARLIQKLKRKAAALARRFQPHPYEVRVWDFKKLYTHRARTYAEALLWVECYGRQFGDGIANIWKDGKLVGSRVLV